MNHYVPTDEIARLSRGSLQERAVAIAADAVEHLKTIDPKAKIASSIATFDDRVLLLSESGEAISVPFTVSGETRLFGLPERVAVRKYSDANKDTWVVDEAVEVAELLRIGSADEAKKRLRVLAESIAPGGAYTTEAILKRLATGLSNRSGWADVYAEKTREIRAAIHGHIGTIQESLPKERFRVLATEHAPEEPERFRAKLVESLRSVLSRYGEIATRMLALDISNARGADRFMGLAESSLLQNLSGFVASLTESAAAVSKDGSQILIIEADAGDIPRLARMHDLLADGLEDFSVCATFVEQLLGAIKSPTSVSGGTPS